MIEEILRGRVRLEKDEESEKAGRGVVRNKRKLLEEHEERIRKRRRTDEDERRKEEEERDVKRRRRLNEQKRRSRLRSVRYLPLTAIKPRKKTSRFRVTSNSVCDTVLLFSCRLDFLVVYHGCFPRVGSLTLNAPSRHLTLTLTSTSTSLTLTLTLTLTSPHLTSPHVTSRHLTSPHVTSRHLTSPHVTSRHLTSRLTPHVTSSHITTNTFAYSCDDG